MTVHIDTGFANGDTLRSIREDFLNPTAGRVASLVTKTASLDAEVATALVSAKRAPGEKKIRFGTRGDPVDLDLTGMFREGSDLSLIDAGSTHYPDITELYLRDADITPGTGGRATVEYKWDNVVPAHQEWLEIGKAGSTPTTKPKGLMFKGKGVTVEATTANLTTVTIPDSASMTGKIGEATPKAIDGIQLIGNVANSSFEGTTLKINIPDGGSGGGTGGITNQNFKGFFSTLGEIQSQVSDPENNKSYAFAKDSELGGTFYTPYFYVNNDWNELKQDPALTYSGPSESTTHGVFSIKPDARISVDNTGQVDLSNLGKDEYFVGFYESQDALNAAVPNPVLEKSFAYVKHGNTGAWIAQYYTHNDKGNIWLKVAPQGALPLINLNTDGSIKTIQNFFSVKGDSRLSVDTSGMLVIQEPDPKTTIKVAVKGEGGTTEGEVETLEFEAGKSYATISDKKLILNNPQRVISYDSEFESKHNGKDFEGSIYYDESSRCWMGWGVPEAPSGVDKKWTKIAHPKMSEEVRDLLKRVPAKAPYVTTGVLGDAPLWQHNGWTYVKKDDSQLPEDFKERCGAYISTVIQDVVDDTPRPQERLQICYADEKGGHCYVRTWEKGASAGSADQGWRPWVKVSMSQKDITDHNTDPGAHKLHHKFYKVATVDLTWPEVKSKNWKISDRDLLLIADSHGISKDGEDTITIPYDGDFRFSGRAEFDGLTAPSSVYPKPQFILYVYKVTTALESVIAEFSYNHTNHTTPIPPLKWKSKKVTLAAGDKVRFEFREFGGTLDTQTNLSLVTSRTYFVVEDFNTTAGSRIANTHKRTVGAVNSKKDVGINVHRSSASSENVRLYGLTLPTNTVDMTTVKKKEIL